MTAPISVLSGSLIRDDTGRWQWRDGTPEPRVRDLSPDEWNFRCRTGGDGETYVEVLSGLARETDALAWVLEGARGGRYPQGQSLDHTGPLTVRQDGSVGRAHIRPGEDPLHGAEPLPEVPGRIPRVILVPIAEWDRWVRENPAGATWDKRDEEAILARARELGWSEPPRA